MFPAVGSEENLDVRPQLVGAQETMACIVGIEEPKEDADSISRELVDLVDAQGDVGLPDDVFEREMAGLREIASLSLVIGDEVARDRVRALASAVYNGIAALAIRPFIMGDLPITCAAREGFVDHLASSRLADSNAPIQEQESGSSMSSASSARESRVGDRRVERSGGCGSFHGIQLG